MTELTEEDLIIENLILEGGLQYEDVDFMPIKQSLYEIESIAPQYDEGTLYRLLILFLTLQKEKN